MGRIADKVIAEEIIKIIDVEGRKIKIQATLLRKMEPAYETESKKGKAR